MSKMKARVQYISGICKCGHLWEDHHQGMIMNKEYYDALIAQSPNHPASVAQECEFWGCNEDGGVDEFGRGHCGLYVDKESPDKHKYYPEPRGTLA